VGNLRSRIDLKVIKNVKKKLRASLESLALNENYALEPLAKLHSEIQHGTCFVSVYDFSRAANGLI
jgi:hypothetical protein